MRRALGVIGVLAATAVATAAAATGLKATIAGPTHKPKIKTKWYYVVRVTDGGAPIKAKLTMQIVDPIGGVHLVQFGPSTKYIKSWPISGTFRDYIIWPAESRGIPLTLRATLVTAKGKTVARYSVVPR